MTKSKRGRYTLEFKQEAARLVESGQSQAASARSLGVFEQTLGNWVREHRAGTLKGASGKPQVTAEQMENSRLRPALGPVVKIDEVRIREHLDVGVRSTVEETLNALLDAEADELCGARKYERTEGRKDTRAGSYDRRLHTKAGEVTLTVPKLRNLPFETAIIERYRRRESSVEEALIEMYLAGVSVRRVEDITQALWGTRVSASTVSDLNQKIYGKINEWRERPLVGEFPYVFLDGLWLKRSWGGEVKNVSVLVAIGVAQSGYREILAVSEGAKEA